MGKPEESTIKLTGHDEDVRAATQALGETEMDYHEKPTPENKAKIAAAEQALRALQQQTDQE